MYWRPCKQFPFSGPFWYCSFSDEPFNYNQSLFRLRRMILRWKNRGKLWELTCLTNLFLSMVINVQFPAPPFILEFRRWTTHERESFKEMNERPFDVFSNDEGHCLWSQSWGVDICMVWPLVWILMWPSTLQDVWALNGHKSSDGSLVKNDIKSAREIPSFSKQMPRKFHDLNLSKIHVMFQHGKQIKPGLTWNCPGIWCGFRWQTAVDLWRQKWLGFFMRIHVIFFTGTPSIVNIKY